MIVNVPRQLMIGLDADRLVDLWPRLQGAGGCRLGAQARGPHQDRQREDVSELEQLAPRHARGFVAHRCFGRCLRHDGSPFDLAAGQVAGTKVPATYRVSVRLWRR